MQVPVYVDVPRYDLWLKAVLFGTPLVMVVAGLSLLSIDITVSYVMFAEAVFIGVLFRLVMPTRYLIYEDRLRIVLGGPFGMNIPFARIRVVRSGSRGWVPTINLITSMRGVLQIDRTRGMSVVISPSRRDLFLDALALYLDQSRIDRGQPQPALNKAAPR